jgi:hypothetical protein
MLISGGRCGLMSSERIIFFSYLVNNRCRFTATRVFEKLKEQQSFSSYFHAARLDTSAIGFEQWPLSGYSSPNCLGGRAGSCRYGGSEACRVIHSVYISSTEPLLLVFAEWMVCSAVCSGHETHRGSGDSCCCRSKCQSC